MEAHELKPLRKRMTRRLRNKWHRRAARRVEQGWPPKREPIRFDAPAPDVLNHRRTQSQKHTHDGERARRARAAEWRLAALGLKS